MSESDNNKTNKLEKLIQVKGLKTEFLLEEGVLTAVDDVSFSVNKGETLGIVGESGSGKSVTSFSICNYCLNGSQELVKVRFSLKAKVGL